VAAGESRNLGVVSPGAPPWIDVATGRSRILIALLLILLLSDLPQIVLRDGMGIDVPWMPWLLVGVATSLWLVSNFVAGLRPFQSFLAVMAVVLLAIAGLQLLFESDAWAATVPARTQSMVALLATRMVMLVLGIAILAVALLAGATRAEVFLRRGDLDAPTTTRRKDGSYLRWRRFGALAFAGIMLLMVWFAAPQLPAHIDLAAALPYVAIGAVAAACNAFWEEAAFRAAPLSMLQRAVGPSLAVLMLALWFGIGHYYGGIPSGPMGLLAAGLLAVLFGRSMIETRGLGWPVALHFAGDLTIFTFLAIASVA
jgi:membrane protease YdiL (CAAX protease family)